MTQPVSCVTPRFGAIALRVDLTQAHGLPSATAYVSDYRSRGYGDGDIFIVTPSQALQPLVTNNPIVADFTQAVRAITRNFNDRNPDNARITDRARPVFKEIRDMFQHGELPMSGTEPGNALYTRLFETERRPGSRTVERIVTEALGFSFLSPNPSEPSPNDRLIFMDRTGCVFNPSAVATPVPSAESA